MDILVQFPPPDALLNLNDRMHHISRWRIAQNWRAAAWAHGVNSRAELTRAGITFPLGPSLVVVELPVRDVAKRRDPHNFVATVKPIVDGLVQAGFWQDDNSEWVTVAEPVFHARSESQVVRVRITPR